MARISFKLPDIGEGIAEAEIVAWHVKVGDRIEEDDPLADMMTDKATVEMTSPVSGVVVELNGAVGDQVAIGSVLAVFEAEGEADAEPTVQVAPPEAGQVALPDPLPQPVAEPIPEPFIPSVVEGPSPTPAPGASTSLGTNGSEKAGAPDRKVLASPAVRDRARALGVNLADVKPAQGDRVRHADLDAFLSYSDGYRPAGAARADEQIRVIGLRRRIAENMAASKRHIPHFTYVDEIDVTKLEALREDLNATRGDKPKLTMLPLLIVAIVRALPDFPMLNARYDDEAGVVTRFGAIHLGLATQTDTGLMVPVIRDAQSRNIWQLAGEIRRLAEAARTGKARIEELSGSTLTLTSLGPLGGIATTPVINRPEVAIIGPNKIVERPVFRDGQVVAAKLMNLSISCDHRVVDGWDAASFVQAVKRLVETPALLFVD
ncbi:dihydrolipoamide acetyltransferase family protein [Sphingomonas naphthae]|uniref:Dihydrolipoamide acetyltransferase component of pyruvate dehydrogenase complex n=1 Tax=Sphingomonas naphthae TaxID=1813468 RepID=A0ABY7TMF2_9SPHN|nr:dihydrolipoamide acetyltransferase family protein [Sphingomonas naphthae]WCT74392.1 dihydrolipoamide acetyltransferase family protein [Sphingomonas naphthae]